MTLGWARGNAGHEISIKYLTLVETYSGIGQHGHKTRKKTETKVGGNPFNEDKVRNQQLDQY